MEENATIAAKAPTPTAPRRAGEWRVQWGPTLRMTLLIALGAMLVVKVLRGDVLLYVNRIYVRLILAAALTLIVLGYVAGLRWLVQRGGWATPHLHAGEGHDHATGALETAGYVLLAVPLLLGLLVPARPLGSAAVASRGSDTGLGANVRTRPITALGDDTSRWTLLDWTTAFIQTPDLRTYAETPVAVLGFVTPSDGGLGDGYFTVARFVIVCCVADGNAVTLPVRWETPLARDTWVQVQGTLAIGTTDGKPTPYIVATAVQTVARPAQPYLYP